MNDHPAILKGGISVSALALSAWVGQRIPACRFLSAPDCGVAILSDLLGYAIILACGVHLYLSFRNLRVLRSPALRPFWVVEMLASANLFVVYLVLAVSGQDAIFFLGRQAFVVSRATLLALILVLAGRKYLDYLWLRES